jgi:hypothetical protein
LQIAQPHLSEDGLVLGRIHLVLLRQVQPQLRELEGAAGLLELGAVELLVDDP